MNKAASTPHSVTTLVLCAAFAWPAQTLAQTEEAPEALEEEEIDDPLAADPLGEAAIDSLSEEQQAPNQENADDATRELFDFLSEEQITIETATRTAQNLDEAPAIVSVITRRQLQRLGVRSLTDLLMLIPGFYSALSPDGAREIVVRGRGSDASNGVKILLNGHSLNEPFSGGATVGYDDRPLDDVKQIEIIRGPGSALYGANAFVSVINIITHDSDGASIAARGDSDRGAYGTGSVHKTFAELDNLKVGLNVSALTSDGPAGDLEADRSFGTIDAGQSFAPGPVDRGHQRVDLDFKASWKGLKLNVGWAHRRRGDNAGTEFLLTNDPSNPSSNSKIQYQHLFADLQASTDVTKNITLVARVFADRMRGDNLLRLTRPGFTLFNDLDGDGDVENFPEGMVRRRKRTEWILGAELQAILEPFPGNELVAGILQEVHLQRDIRQLANFDPVSRASLDDGYQRVTGHSVPSYDRGIKAAYIQDLWRLSEVFSVTGGLRIDRYSDFGYAISPRGAAVVQPVSGLYLKALYGQAFRAPTFRELFSRANPDLIGNPSLDAERLQTGELNLIWRVKDRGELANGLQLVDRFDFKVAGFYTQVRDAIVPLRPEEALTGPRRFRNVGTARYSGAEFEVQWALLDALSLASNFTYQMAEDRDTGEEIPNVPHMLSNASASYSPVNWVFGTLGVRVLGSRTRPPGDNPQDGSGLPLVPGRQSPLSSNIDLWASVGVEQIDAGPFQLRITLRGENLLDRDLRDPSDAPYTERGALTFPLDMPLRGPTVMAQIEVTHDAF